MRNILVVLFCISVVTPSFAYGATISDRELQEVVYAGTVWLAGTQEDTGHFRYEYAPYRGTYSTDDNIVRQAGALFQLGEIERYDEGNTYVLKEELERSLKYFETLSVSGDFSGTDFRCIKEAKAFSCKLGATALAAIGLMNTLAEYPELKKKYEPLLHDYMAYIMAMKKDASGFRYYYYPSRKKQNDTESSFSNGEAFLALVRFEKYSEDTKVRDVVDETFEYLNTKAPFDAPLYLWAMAAVKDLHILLRPHGEYVSYAERFTKWRLLDNARYQNSTQNRCPYIEGLASAASLLEEQSLTGTVEVLIDSLLAAHKKLQIGKEHLYRYDMKNRQLTRLKDEHKAFGGFLTGFGEGQDMLRIDFTQHCLSAYAQTLVDLRGGAL